MFISNHYSCPCHMFCSDEYKKPYVIGINNHLYLTGLVMAFLILITGTILDTSVFYQVVAEDQQSSIFIS